MIQGADWRTWWPPAGYVLLVVVLTLVLWQSGERLGAGEAGLTSRVHLELGDSVLGRWMHWDGGVYYTIAEHGYPEADVEVFEARQEAKIAFFPGFPLLGRAVATVIGDAALALILTAVISGLVLSLVFHRWLRDHVDSARAATLALLALFLFPWAYVLAGAAYSEALFLLCTIGAFLLLERDRPLAAGLLGAVAAATRVVGVAVILGMLVLVLERRGALSLDRWRPRVAWRRARRRDLGVLLAVLGLASFMAFCWARYGDPVAFSTAQRGWGSPAGLRTWVKAPFFDLVLHSPDVWFVRRLMLHGVVGALFLSTIPAVWRRFGAGYGVYTTIVVAVPMIGSAAFSSMGRHTLAAFPIFALAGEHLALWPRWRAALALAASSLVLLTFTSFWGRGYWMA